VLSVGAAPFAPHTARMTTDTRATAFVTGAAGFIGTALVKAPVARGHQALGPTRSGEAAERVTLEQGIRQIPGALRE
jgi:nucleoside-diphosphate-sugar epimerase